MKAGRVLNEHPGGIEKQKPVSARSARSCGKSILMWGGGWTVMKLTFVTDVHSPTE